ncbi:unnamed protein product [Rhizophagus irregularis]|uniref:Uncharacterized protein n=1 Tax=Rhizophagus irregularis TaxID=588596 RepID=A0A916EHX9_9GLOM|nr:unnamed protein product [Rhizophagus irregularis]
MTQKNKLQVTYQKKTTDNEFEINEQALPIEISIILKKTRSSCKIMKKLKKMKMFNNENQRSCKGSSGYNHIKYPVTLEYLVATRLIITIWKLNLHLLYQFPLGSLLR